MPDSWILGNASDNTNVILNSMLCIIFSILMIETVVLSYIKGEWLTSYDNIVIYVNALINR